MKNVIKNFRLWVALMALALYTKAKSFFQGGARDLDFKVSVDEEAIKNYNSQKICKRNGSGKRKNEFSDFNPCD